jgi:hypothetical protein
MTDSAMDLVITEAAAAALTRGQGHFSRDELAMAAADLKQCVTKGAIAQLVLEGVASMAIQEGEVKYKAPTNGA